MAVPNETWNDFVKGLEKRIPGLDVNQENLNVTLNAPEITALHTILTNTNFNDTEIDQIHNVLKNGTAFDPSSNRQIAAAKLKFDESVSNKVTKNINNLADNQPIPTQVRERLTKEISFISDKNKANELENALKAKSPKGNTDQTTPKNIVQKKSTPATSVLKEPSVDVMKILEEIRNHLKRFTNIENKYTHTNTLTIGTNQITIECLLYYWSKNSSFVHDKTCEDYIEQNKSFNFTSMIEMRNKPINKENKLTDEEWKHDSSFYANLYNYNISIAETIVNDPRFNKLSHDNQYNILDGYRSFIAASITFTKQYMAKYKVIDDNLIKNSYSLLYLLNITTQKHANVSKNIDELTSIYNQLTTTIEQNIKLYNTINFSKIVKGVDILSKKNREEINKLISELDARLKILQDQHNTLQRNVQTINEDATYLSQLANKDVVIIANKLNTQKT